MVEKNKIIKICRNLDVVWIVIIIILTTGCSKEESLKLDSTIVVIDDAVQEENSTIENIAAIYRDGYEDGNTMDQLERMQWIIDKLGENGYVAVDNENQIDITHTEQVIKFCEAVDTKQTANIMIIVLLNKQGFKKLDLQTKEGTVYITSGYYEYNKGGYVQNKSTVQFQADLWQYTQEGYLLFEGRYLLDEKYVLMLSDVSEHMALRVLPLDKKCRELNRRYILPIGYKQNNLFLSNWSENDFGELNFYDLFDVMYPMRYQQPMPYVADENLQIGAIYQIPQNIFEEVLLTYFNIDTVILQSKTNYLPESRTYEYKPRGFYEAECSNIPYPEVVAYTENQDGTITLIVHAIYANENTAKAYSHKTVIRPNDDGSFQYVSNQILSPQEEYNLWWHIERLTDKEWEAIYENKYEGVAQ